MDCFITSIDYTKKLPDFKLVPQEVVKTELSQNGIRTTIKKGEIMKMITEIWQYRKLGEIPFNYKND